MSTSTTTNPGPLGLFGFAMTTLLYSLINAGIESDSNINLVLAMAIAFGGVAQVIAGMFEYGKSNTLGFSAFMSYGMFWLSFVLLKVFFEAGVTSQFVGWYLLIWGLLTFVFVLASMRANVTLKWVFIIVTVTLFVLSAGNFMQNLWFMRVGGYLGLMAGALSFYLGAAQLINICNDKKILPF